MDGAEDGFGFDNPLVDITKLQALQQLPAHVQSTILPALQYRRVEAGDVLLRQGEAATHWLILCTGSASVHVRYRRLPGCAVHTSLRSSAVYGVDAAQLALTTRLADAERAAADSVVGSTTDYTLTFNAAQLSKAAQLKRKTVASSRRVSHMARGALGPVHNVLSPGPGEDPPPPEALELEALGPPQQSAPRRGSRAAALSAKRPHASAAAAEDVAWVAASLPPLAPLRLPGASSNPNLVDLDSVESSTPRSARSATKPVSPRPRVRPSHGADPPLSPRSTAWAREQSMLEEGDAARCAAVESAGGAGQDTPLSTARKADVAAAATTRFGGHTGTLACDSTYGAPEMRWGLPYGGTVVALEPGYIALCPCEAYLAACVRRLAPEMPRPPRESHLALCRPAASRVEADVAAITSLLSKCRFFGDYPRAEVRTLAGMVTRRVLPDRWAAFVQGQCIKRGAVYIVLTGSLSLHVNTADEASPVSAIRAAKAPPAGGQGGRPSLSGRPGRVSSATDLDDFALFAPPGDLEDAFGPCVTLLHPGDGFGEAALFGAASTRTYTALAREATVVLELRRGDLEALQHARPSRSKLVSGSGGDTLARLVAALQVPPADRPPADAALTARKTAHLGALGALGEGARLHLCSRARYLRLEAGELLFWPGEPLEDCCLLLAGGVTTHVRDESSSLDREGGYGGPDCPGACHGVMGVGAFVGLDALREPWRLSPPPARAAYLAQTPCSVMHFRRCDLQEAATAARAAGVAQQLAALATVPCLTWWPPATRLKLAECMRQVVFPAGGCLIRRGKAVDTLYLLRRGTAAAVVDRAVPCPCRHPTRLPDLRPGRTAGRGAVVRRALSAPGGRLLGFGPAALTHRWAVDDTARVVAAIDPSAPFTPAVMLGLEDALAGHPAASTVGCGVAVHAWAVPACAVLDLAPLESMEKHRASRLRAPGAPHASAAARNGARPPPLCRSWPPSLLHAEQVQRRVPDNELEAALTAADLDGPPELGDDGGGFGVFDTFVIETRMAAMADVLAECISDRSSAVVRSWASRAVATLATARLNGGAPGAWVSPPGGPASPHMPQSPLVKLCQTPTAAFGHLALDDPAGGDEDDDRRELLKIMAVRNGTRKLVKQPSKLWAAAAPTGAGEAGPADAGEEDDLLQLMRILQQRNAMRA